MNKILLCIFILSLLEGCYYPKVNLSRSERRLIAYDKQKVPVVFCSEAGVCDTMRFNNAFTRNGYKRNFDQWWEIHISHTVMPHSRRGFYYSVIGTSNFPANNYSEKNLNLLYIKLSLVKSENDRNLTLHMDGFEESYVLDEHSKTDTLEFKDLTSDGTCPSGKCLRKAYWTATGGLITLEKYDGSVWVIKF